MHNTSDSLVRTAAFEPSLHPVQLHSNATDFYSLSVYFIFFLAASFPTCFLAFCSCFSVLSVTLQGAIWCGDWVLLYQRDTKLTLSKTHHVSDIALLTLGSHIKINNQKHCILIDQGLCSQKAPNHSVHLGPLPWSTMKLRSYYVFKCSREYQARPQMTLSLFSNSGQIVITHPDSSSTKATKQIQYQSERVKQSSSDGCRLKRSLWDRDVSQM